MNIMLIINLILLLIMLLGSLFISSHLHENIDDYVLVYNYLKKIDKNSILLVLLSNNKFSKNKFKANNRYLSSSSYNSNKFNFNYNRYKWFKLLIDLLLIIILSIIQMYIPINGVIFKYINYIIFIVGGLIISYFIMELYLIDKFQKYNEKPKLYKYIPAFIKKDILNLYEISKLDLESRSAIVDNTVFTLLCVIILFLIYIIFIILLKFYIIVAP